MKIAFLFGAWSIGSRPLDFNNLFASPRGLTGSDLGVCMTAKEMASFGHSVSLFTVHGPNKPDTWESVKLYHIGDKNRVIADGNFDAVISWSEPDILRDLPARPVKVVCQMLNDFSYCQPGYDNCVDAWTAPCQMLIDHLVKQSGAPSENKFTVLPLGCNPAWYSDRRVLGRVIWASSADRGLHLLLQEWPKIKKASPQANLRIFYNFDYGGVEGMEPNSNNHPHFLELGHRARYMKAMIKRLQHLDVQHIGSVSRDRIQQEMSEASVMAFPCDTVAFTEGFSVSILEAHASRTVPVITDTDCLGQVYENSGAIVIKDIKHNLPAFTNAVIGALNDKSFADETINKCSKFAEDHTWKESAKKLETIINNISNHKTNDMMEIILPPSINKTVKKPKVSVLDLTNRVGGMDILFESMRHQSFQDFELIIVDALYKYRKDIVAEKAKQYNFPVKHIEPYNNTFPVSSYNNSMNTGLCVAEGEILHFTCDYAFMQRETLATHVNFHNQTPRTHILMLPCHDAPVKLEAVSSHFPKKRQYGHRGQPAKTQLLTVPEADYVKAHNEWSDRYVEDLDNGFLDNVLWSIFEQPFTYEQGIDHLVQNIVIDTKFNMCSKTEPTPAFHDLNCVKNDSFKLDLLLEANGFDEKMDGTWGFFDTELSRRLLHCHGAKFFAMDAFGDTVINTRYYLEPRKIVNGYQNIKIIDAKYNKEQPLLDGAVADFKKKMGK